MIDYSKRYEVVSGSYKGIQGLVDFDTKDSNTCIFYHLEGKNPYRVVKFINEVREVKIEERS